MKYLLSLTFLLFTLPVFAESQWDKEETDIPVIEAEIQVYRSPDCQCCHRWIEHLQRHHFKVIDHVTQDMTRVKEKLGLPMSMASCHTALVNGYLIEGHVPAKDIIRLLQEKPDIKGLSVPQMPVGGPGMEMGMRKDNFAVIAFDHNNKLSLFDRYEMEQDHLYHAQPIRQK